MTFIPGPVGIRASVLTPVGPPPPPPPPPYTGSSPTGRDPLFLWSAPQQGVWNQMAIDNHWYYAAVLANAQKSGTPQQRYSDGGEWATYMYQITGDVTWAQKAWPLVWDGAPGVPGLNKTLSSLGTNACREHFAMKCVLVDWLWPSLDATQRANAVTKLNVWADFATANGTAANVGGISFADSDHLFGYYAGLLALNYFNEPENTYYLNVLNRVDRLSGKVLGGPAATAVDNATIRNGQERLLTFASGGEWIEGEEYNTGTGRLVMMLYAIAEKVSPGSYPLLGQFIANLCEKQWYGITPDYQQSVQWGDLQNPRAFNGGRQQFYWTTQAMAAGLAIPIDATKAAKGQAVVNASYTQYTGLIGGSAFTQRAFLFYNPYATASTLPTGRNAYYVTGMQQQFVKDTESLYWSYVPANLGVDHEMRYNSTYQLYRNGEWLITNPLGYASGLGSIQASNRGNNSIMVAGCVSSPGWDRQQPYHDTGADWVSFTATASGIPYDYRNKYAKPPQFLTSYLRQAVHVKTGSHDVIIDVSDINAVDPLTLSGGVTNYQPSSPPDQAGITDKIAMKVHALHSRYQPTFAGNVASFTTPLGTLVEVHDLSPTAMTHSVVNEATLYGTPSGYNTSEFKWQMLSYEASEQQATRIVKVILAGTATKPAVSYNNALNRVTVGTRTFQFGATGVSEV